MPIDTPTTKANVVAQFIETIHETSVELAAWRRFGAEVAAFLKARDLTDAFGEFQEAQQKERDALVRRAAKATNAKRRAR